MAEKIKQLIREYQHGKITRRQFNALGPASPFRGGACYGCHKEFLAPQKKSGG